MSMSVSVDQVQRFLIKDYIKPCQEWLQDCVGFYCENHRNSNNLLQDTCKFAKDQWLLEDIAETASSTGCILPPNLINQKHTTLRECYALQVNYFIDIGTSFFKQLQHLQKAAPLDVAENDEQQTQQAEVSGQRTLKLCLTDGKQQIFGLEYGPLKINVKNIVPGLKVLIKGPVDCRRGILMLKAHNIVELGGHVESIFEANDQCKIITNRLANPEYMENSDNITAFRGAPSKNIKNQFSKPTNTHPHSASTRLYTREEPNDDEIDALMAELPDMNDEFLADPFEAPSNTAKKFRPSESTNPTPQSSNVPEFPIEDDEFEIEFDDDDLIISNSGQTRIGLLELNKMTVDGKKDKTFIVKAQMHSTLGKLKFKNNEWGMKCKITDQIGFLDVSMENDVITKLLKEIGYDCRTEDVKKQANDPGAKEKLSKALLELKQKMARMNDHYITFKQNEAFVRDIIDCNR